MKLPRGHDWFESDMLKEHYAEMDGQYHIPVWECKVCKLHLSITAEKTTASSIFCYRKNNSWVDCKNVPTCAEIRMMEALE